MLTQTRQSGSVHPHLPTQAQSTRSEGSSQIRRALIVEDDEVLCRFLGRLFEMEGFQVAFVHSGDAALANLSPELDIVILDLNLPGVDGLTVLQTLRAQFDRLPVLVLTGRARAESAVLALENGADDCLTKPFSHTELLARTRAILRRNYAKAPATTHCGSLVVNRSALRVTREGERVDLTPREYSLLELLMRSPGIPVSRTTLMKEVWGEDITSGSSNVVDVYMKYLRDKIDLPGLQKLIRTVRGVGYVISEL